MFTSLHELAKQATLMITITAEGADQLRVNVTPMPFDTKAKSNLPQPLSLVASPAEFDADFSAALLTWHAPKRSLVEQAMAVASTPTAAPALPAPKADAKSDKPGKKGRGKASTNEEPVPAQAAVEAAGKAATTADHVVADSAAESSAGAGADVDAVREQDAQPADAEPVGAVEEPEAAPAPAVDQEPVDKFTLDLF